jgi:predicted DNA-binding protein
MNFTLDSNTIESIKTYSQLLQKDSSTIIKEALEDYFAKVEKELLEESFQKESALTNLSYDEFFDGLDFDDD